jgi:haloacetate dehalogenase
LGTRLACPTLALWGANGLMHTLMDIEAAWRARCADLRVGTVPGGHWFPEQAAPETAQALLLFFESQGR